MKHEQIMAKKGPHASQRPHINSGPVLLQTNTHQSSQMQHYRNIGNEAVQRMMESGAIQAKLTIGQPNDKYEQEADRVADQIMRMTEGSLVNSHWSLGKREKEGSLVNGDSSLVQRQSTCPECMEEEEEVIQTKQTRNQVPAMHSNIETGINSLKGGGQPLPESTRAFFESRFGFDFSRVRLHTNVHASDTAQSINAKAFTIGQNIVFGSGQYRPRTSEGQRLLAHELTHVLQQKGAAGSTVRPLSGYSDHKALEKNPEKKKLGASDMRSCSKPLLKAGLGIQRFQGPPENPDIIAVRNGPDHGPIEGWEMFDYQDRVVDHIYGMWIGIHVIGAPVRSLLENLQALWENLWSDDSSSSEAGPGPESTPEERVNLDDFQEREQTSNSFNHTGAFVQSNQQGRSLPFARLASGWQDAFNVEPDKHALPISMITQVADLGGGSFDIDQLSLYKQRNSRQFHVVPFSGYRITYTIREGDGESIQIHIQKRPRRVEVRGSEGAFRAQGGHDENGWLVGIYEQQVTVPRESVDVSERIQPAGTAVASRETRLAGEMLTVSNFASPRVFRYVSPEWTEVPKLTEVPQHEGSLISYTHDNSTLYGEDREPMPTHVEQGNLGNCWFGATLAALASTQRGKRHIMEHIRPNMEITDDAGHTYSRTYTVTLYDFLTGGARHYRMSPIFPTGYSRTPPGGGESGPTSGAIIWVALYERAFAHHRGSTGYDSLDGETGIRSYGGFRIITGERSSREELIREDMESSDLIHIWRLIWNALHRGFAVVIQPRRRSGRRSTHAYSVLRAYTRDGQYKLDLYNPWGWYGRRTDYRSITTVEDFSDQAIGTGYSKVTFEGLPSAFQNIGRFLETTRVMINFF